MHGASKLNCGRDNIDALLHAFQSYRLRTEDATIRYREQKLKMNRAGAWVVASMVARVEVHFLEARHAGTPQSLFACTGRRNREAQHTNNRGGLYPAKVRRTSGDGLGRHAALAIRRACEREHCVLSRQDVRHFN